MTPVKSPRISVIITCYNYESYVAQAIESVLNQTYENIELIIVNDGSTDDSDKIIKEYVKRNPGIIYINQKNHGVVYTRNMGMEIASGDYLCCLDADDFFNPDYIQRQYDYITKYKVDVVYPNWQLLGDLNYKTNFPEFNFIEYQKQHLHIKPESLIRVSAIKHHNGKLKYAYIPETKARANDWAYFISLAANGLTFKLASDNYVNYRIKAGSMAKSFSREQDIKIFFNYLTMFKKRFGQKIIDPVELPIDIIKQQDIAITTKDELIRGQSDLIKEKDRVIVQQRTALYEMERSLSWRVTRPLRKLKKVLRKKT